MFASSGLGHSFLRHFDWLAAGFCAGASLPTFSSFSPRQPSPPSTFFPPPQFSSSRCAIVIIFFTMFRSAIVRSLRAAAPRAAIRTPAPFQIRSSPIAVRTPQFTPCFVSQAVRCYSAPAGLSQKEVEGRIVNLLKNFDKVRHIRFSRGCLSEPTAGMNFPANFECLCRFPTRARSVVIVPEVPWWTRPNPGPRTKPIH